MHIELCTLHYALLTFHITLCTLQDAVCTLYYAPPKKVSQTLKDITLAKTKTKQFDLKFHMNLDFDFVLVIVYFMRNKQSFSLIHGKAFQPLEFEN